MVSTYPAFAPVLPVNQLKAGARGCSYARPHGPGPTWPVALVLAALPLGRTREKHPPLTRVTLEGQSSLYRALCVIKGLSYCDIFINKYSDMPVPALCSCCDRSGGVTLTCPVVLQCPRPTSALQLLSSACPTLEGQGEHASGPKGSMALQAWHRQGLAAATHWCQRLAVAAQPLSTEPARVPECSRPGQPGISCCSGESWAGTL